MRLVLTPTPRESGDQEVPAPRNSSRGASLNFLPVGACAERIDSPKSTTNQPIPRSSQISPKKAKGRHIQRSWSWKDTTVASPKSRATVGNNAITPRASRNKSEAPRATVGSKAVTPLTSRKSASPRATAGDKPRASSKKPTSTHSPGGKKQTSPRASGNKTPTSPRASGNKTPTAPRASGNKTPTAPRGSGNKKPTALRLSDLPCERTSRAPRRSAQHLSPRYTKRQSFEEPAHMVAFSPESEEKSPTKRPTERRERPPHKRAVVIGINYTGQGRRELCGCVNDAFVMKDLLLSSGWEPDNLRILTDDGNTQSPTRRNIIDACKWLVLDARPGDIFALSFSGHGSQKEDRKGYEDDGLNETLIPVDVSVAGMISDDELNGIMVRPLESGCKFFAIVDACHSGTMLDLPYRWQDGRWKEDVNPYHTKGDVVLISGCKDKETSADDDDGGAMTKAFATVLQRSKEEMTYVALMANIHRELRSGGFPQRPMLTSSQPFDSNRIFSFDDIIPNENKTLGRIFRRSISPKKKKRKFGLGELTVFLLLIICVPTLVFLFELGWIGWAAWGGVVLLYCVLVSVFCNMLDVRLYLRMIGLRIWDLLTCCCPRRKSLADEIDSQWYGSDSTIHVCE